MRFPLQLSSGTAIISVLRCSTARDIGKPLASFASSLRAGAAAISSAEHYVRPASSHHITMCDGPCGYEGRG